MDKIPAKSAAEALREREAAGAIDRRDQIAIWLRDRPWLLPSIFAGFSVFLLGALLGEFRRYTPAQRRYAIIVVLAIWSAYTVVVVASIIIAR